MLAGAFLLGGLATAGPASANHEGTPSGVSVVAAQSSVTIPSSMKLTVSADRHLYGTGYSVSIVDEDKGVTMGPCSQPCDLYAGTFWEDNANPQPRHFHGELRGPNAGLVATSGQVTVDVRKHTWNIVSVVPNPASRVVPGSIQFVATLDHTTSGSPYDIFIYDEDSTSFSNCNQYICGLYINRQWADNVNPSPGRVRVVVRHRTSGDVASDTVYASAPFRRFIFTPTLSFWTQTTNGAVVHKASARLAATDPSLSGTPYSIKIRKADGTEACSAPQYGCDATVTVGETYRGVVEDSQGRNFGQSTAWTLTGSGPQPATVGEVDLAALAAAARGVDICAELGLSPVKTDVVEPHTSGGDQWEACAAAAAVAGATTLTILKAVADTPGGEANLWWLQGDVTKEITPPDTEPGSDDAKAPRPVPPPLLPDIQKLAERLMSQNQEIDQPAADDVATQCTFLHWRAGKNPGRCSALPIFASGSDVAEATNHDLGALAEVGYVPWLLLNREQSSTKPGDGWQTTGGRCTPTDLRACHEYPFFGTEQGGPLAYKRGPEPIIGLVLREQNGLQGTRYSQFISACKMKAGTPDPTGQENSSGGDPFLSIPLPPEWGPRPTLWLCNGKTE